MPLLQSRGSGPTGDLPEAAVFLDLEGGGAQPPASADVAQDETRSADVLQDWQLVLQAAVRRPGMALSVATLLLCLAVSAGCWAMNAAGWILLFWSPSSRREEAGVRNWLLVYLVGVLVEVGILRLVRICHSAVVQDLDVRVGPGFVKTCNVCHMLISSTLKIFWCVHAQVLAATKSYSGSSGTLPHFVSAFSAVLLLRLLVVDTLFGLMAGWVLRLTASATEGDTDMEDARQSGGPAKAGTLDAMKHIDYSDSPSGGGGEEDARLSRECCFCLEEFDHKEAIVMTPCKHTMHRDCLERWLQRSHLCPICRGDLEES